MERQHSYASGFSSIGLTAIVSALVLVGVGTWQIAQHFYQPQSSAIATAASQGALVDSATNGANTSADDSVSPDPISDVSTGALTQIETAYTGLQAAGIYSTSTGQAVATSIASSLSAPISYRTYVATDIKTSPDTSYAGMMQYRSDLKTSLAPLLKNTQAEFEVYGEYVQTNDPKYLTQLQEIAQNYTDAVNLTAKVTTPTDAIAEELGMLNSMQEFAAVLNALATHAQDPIASAVLLQNYNTAEGDVTDSFNALVIYEQNKHA